MGHLTKPERRPRVAFDAAWVFVGELVAKGGGLVLVVVLARTLGARSYGYFTFAVSLFPLLLHLSRWGVDLTVVRELALGSKRLPSLLANGFVVRTGLALVALVVGIGLAPLFIPDRSAVIAIAVVGAALVADEVTIFIGQVFVAFERNRVNALVLAVNRVASTVLAVAAVALGGELISAAIAYFIGSVIAAVYAAFWLRRSYPAPTAADVDGREIAGLLRRGGAYGFAAMLNMGLFRIDAVILGGLEGAVAVGLYGVAYRFFEPLLFVSWGIAQLALPRLVREHAAASSNRTADVAFAALLAAYLPITAGAPFCAAWMVELVFSDRYRSATPAVLWLTSCIAIYGVAHMARMASVAIGKRKEIAWIAGICLVVNVVGNLLLIPRYSFVGAAAMTFVTQVLEAVLQMTVFLRGGGRISFRPLAAPLIAVLAMLAVLLVAGLRDGAALAAGGTVYLLVLVPTWRALVPWRQLAGSSDSGVNADSVPAEPGQGDNE